MSISESVWAKIEEGRREDRYLKLETLFQELAAAYRPDELIFLCIGTDRSSGDAFGPLVGSRLKAAGFPHVFGTMEAPCDATNLERIIDELPTDLTIVAFDACLGKPGSIGKFLLRKAPLIPAGSMKGTFAPIGNYSVAAVVNTMGPRPYQSLQSASLRLVLQMAEETAETAIRLFEHSVGQTGKFLEN
ncbi:spore protease YyaC [Saccharibacillus sp. O16]|nr:spore protease YyaC [Saccharibacillus sp. O16]